VVAGIGPLFPPIGKLGVSRHPHAEFQKHGIGGRVLPTYILHWFFSVGRHPHADNGCISHILAAFRNGNRLTASIYRRYNERLPEKRYAIPENPSPHTDIPIAFA